MNPIRIAIEETTLNSSDCYLRSLLPSPNCSNLPFILNITLLWGNLVFGSKVKYVVVPGEGWSFKSESRANEIDISVMGLIEADLADITTPDMIQSVSRNERVNYSRINLYAPTCFLYKPIAKLGRVLSTSTLFVGPRGIWTLLFVCFIARKSLETMQRYLERHGIHKHEFDVTRLLHARDRLNLLLLFFYGLGLAVLSKYLFGIFQRSAISFHNISSVEDVISALKTGHYALTADSPAKILHLKKAERGNELYKHPPVILTKEAELEALLRGDTPEKYIFVGDRVMPIVYRLGTAGSGIAKECNGDAHHVTRRVTYVSQRVLPIIRHITQTQISIFRALLKRYEHAYFQAFVFTPRDEEAKQPFWQLNLDQVQGLLRAAGIALCCALSMLLVELLTISRDWHCYAFAHLLRH